MKIEIVNRDENIVEARLDVGWRLILKTSHGDIIIDCKEDCANLFMVCEKFDYGKKPVLVRNWIAKVENGSLRKYGSEILPR